ncbi:MAG: hypothetical protein K0S23_1515 [Fluviicola sp.]|jgi:hypothetical protein|uniref:hypothetical protein n=1 Tax=Fluviicola sp. TaxID=1917219 RepID=UPI0026053483|nr:hypothetical protein [Fluviicola sp.]MDF3027208.1 hypothetical protein [Fluviicola sp.]
MTKFFLFPFLLLPLFSVAQGISQIEQALHGTWHLQHTTEGSIPDSLYSQLKSEGVQFMVFDEEEEAFIKFSFLRETEDYSDTYKGNYRVYRDQKSHAIRIKLKGPFAGCEQRYIEIVSISDTTLTIRSCINPIDLVFVKSPLPKDQIVQTKATLQGKWNHVKTEHSCTIEDSVKRISNRYDHVESLQFYQDSVRILFSKNQQVISSEYYIHHDLRFDLLSLEIPILSSHKCDAPSFVELTNDRMVLFLCDCDFSRVIYEKQFEVKEE